MEFNTDFSIQELVGLVGAIITGIAAFLPWVVAGVEAGPVDISASTTGLEELGAITLVVAIIVVGVITIDDIAQNTFALGLGGLIALIVGLWEFVSLEGAADPGMGLYLTLVGGLVVFAAGVWEYWNEGETAFAARNG